DLENAAATIADVEVPVMIENDSRRDTHAFCEQFRSTCSVDSIHVPFVTTRNKEIAGKAERQAGCIHDVGDERRHRPFRCDLIYRDRSLLSAASAVCRINVSTGIDSRIRDGM